MGELISVLGSLELNRERWYIEMNEPLTIGGNNIIHIQSKDCRFEMSELELLSLASVVLAGAEQLAARKKIK